MQTRRMITVLAICLGILGIDILSKFYTHKYIPLLGFSSSFYPYGGIAVFKDFFGIDFSLNYAMNKGAAWGIFSGFQEYLLCARLLITAGVLIYVVRAKMTFLKRSALFCIITGAVGNVIDFFIYGHVVDMFYFVLRGYSFPVFNVADSIIFCGVVFLFLQGFLEKRFPSLSETT